MIFNSFDFIFFLPVVFCFYWFVCNKTIKTQNQLILIASYIFYGWWDIRFVGLLLFSTALDFTFGFLINKTEGKKRKYILWIGVINNLSVLGIFKYYNFFARTFTSLFEHAGFHVNPTIINVVLPVGISFYTFHGMSYLFDIYRRKCVPVKSFIDYAVFVSFFPLLVAGPIERASHLLPQVQTKRVFSYQQAASGARLILWGMFKKIVVADYIARLVDYPFTDPSLYSATSLIWGAIAFSFQIYCDFSGYSDIAIGTAKLFGFELLSNFKFPYFSRDIAEFWRRWHISLSSWFKDYLYIPLGGSKEGIWQSVRNTFIIFIVSGFWHGASWNYIVWGFIHALGFLPLLLTKKNRVHTGTIVAEHKKLPSFTELRQMLLTFGFVTFAWIFFRSRDLTFAVRYIHRIVTNLITEPRKIFQLPFGISSAAVIIPMLILDWHIRRNEREFYPRASPVVRYIVYLALFMSSVLFFLSNVGSNFIYFQF